jgi:nitrogen regulatory protein P-II 2
MADGTWKGMAASRPVSIHRRITMKLIIAIIQPTKLDAVQKALARLDVQRMTVSDAMGYARQRGQIETYRGHEYKTNLLRKVALEIAVNDDFLDRTIECLEEVARTSSEGHIGDGKIFVLPMEEAIQINDGYRGKGAI